MKPRRPRIREGFPGQRLIVVPPRIVSHALTLPVCQALFPTHIGRFDSAAYHYVERKTGSDEFIFIACLAGAGRCQIGTRSWALEAGNAIVLPPRQYHRYSTLPSMPWTIFWVHFRGKQANEYRKAMGVTPENPRFWIQDFERITEAFEETYQYVLGGYTDHDLLGLSTSLGRLFGLCRILQRSENLRLRVSEERVVRSIRFMRENLHRKLTLSECAKSAGWSPSHFSAKFKHQVNISPMEFLMRLKMTRGCERLKTAQSSIQEIALELGFDDPFYFSRSFHRHLGMAPSQYQKQYIVGDRR